MSVYLDNAKNVAAVGGRRALPLMVLRYKKALDQAIDEYTQGVAADQIEENSRSLEYNWSTDRPKEIVRRIRQFTLDDVAREVGNSLEDDYDFNHLPIIELIQKLNMNSSELHFLEQSGLPFTLSVSNLQWKFFFNESLNLLTFISDR